MNEQEEICDSNSEINTQSQGDFYDNMVNAENNDQLIGIFETNDDSEMDVDSDHGIYPFFEIILLLDLFTPNNPPLQLIGPNHCSDHDLSSKPNFKDLKKKMKEDELAEVET